MTSSDESLRGILESLDEVVWSASVDGRELSYLNAAAERVYGRKVGEFFDSPGLWLEVIHPDDLGRVIAAVGDIASVGSVESEYRIVRPDGGVRWLRDRARLIRDAAGNPLRMDGIASDVTGERRVRDELQTERRFLETLVGNLPGMVYRCKNDPDWTMTFVSPASLELTGYGPAELEAGGSVSYGSLVHPDDRDWLWEKCQVNLERRIPCRNEYRIQHRDGSMRWVWERAIGLYGEAGELQHIEGFVLDITQRRQLEEQLLRSQKLDSIGRLAGGIAHDFNNLLTAILGYADLHERELLVGTPDVGRVRAMRVAAERARDLCGQLLTIARKEVIEPRPVDLSSALLGSRDLIARLLREDIAVDFRLAPALWVVEADPGRIDQIMLNLAANSRDAIPGVGRFEVETANLTLGSEDAARHPGVPPGDWVLLRVSDTGLGMSAEALQRVFEPFFTTKAPGRGTGLGLATVYGIVSQCGGQVRVESRPAVGTTFYLYFPRSQRSPEQVRVVATPAPAPPGPVPVAGTRGQELILLVEDDEDVRSLTAECLRSVGYRVLVTASGREALAAAAVAGEPVALLLTDVVMPEMSGPRVVAALRERQPDLAVLYISGYTGDSSGQLGLVESGVRLLPKPFSVVALLATVRELIDRR